MNWYKGSIAEAVTLSKEKNAIFVVFVEGSDELSLKLHGFIDEEKIRTKLESDNFVAIKIDSASQSLSQFAQIYQLVPLPSIFFIGKNGAPLEVITGIIPSSDELETKINSVLTLAGIKPQTVATTSTPTNASSNFISNEQSASVDSSEIVCENGVCYRKPLTSAAKTDSSINSNAVKSEDEIVKPESTNKPKTIETTATNSNVVSVSQINENVEKLETAKKLLEEKRKEKEAEELRLAREKEIERRKQGKDAQSLQSWQKEQELKQFKENIRREKLEEQSARQKILEKIASDRAERAQKFAPAGPVTAPQPQPDLVTQRPSNGANPESSRIQFKKPGGESETHTFNSSDEFKIVRDFVQNNILMGVKDFYLATTFPRKEFSESDLNKTLLELGLCPTAVLLIITRMSRPSAIVAQSGGFVNVFNTVFWGILSPFFFVFGYLKGLITGQGSSSSSASGSGARKRANEDAPVNDAAKLRNLDRFSNNDVINDRPSTSDVGRNDNKNVPHRRFGGSNVHRLHENKDSDDENNTWNGNSTQQQ